MDTDQAVVALSALAQGSRLSVFRKLVELAPDGTYPGDLAQRLDIPANTLSFHLKSLLHAGLINAEQNGRFIRYRARLDVMVTLVDFLTENCCNSDRSRCIPARTPVRKSATAKTARLR